MFFLFKNYSLVEVIDLLIRCNKTKFFLSNTNNTGRSGVNKQNTHTTNTQRKKTMEQWKGSLSMIMSDTRFFKTPPPPLFHQPIPFHEKYLNSLLIKISNPPLPTMDQWYWNGWIRESEESIKSCWMCKKKRN